MKLNIASVQAVKVKFGEGNFTAKLRVMRISETESMNDVEMVRAALSSKDGTLRADAIDGLEVFDGDSPISGLDLVELCVDHPEISAAIAGAYFREFRNKHLRANTKQPD